MNRVSNVICLIMFIMAVTAAAPALAGAGGDGSFIAVPIDENSFVTVKDTPAGEVLSLYRVRGDQLVLVDTVVNNDRRDTSLPKRYLHRLDVENR